MGVRKAKNAALDITSESVRRTPKARMIGDPSSRKLVTVKANEISPGMVENVHQDDTVFDGNGNGKANLYHGRAPRVSASVHDSDVDAQMESPTASLSRKKIIKAEKIAGSRRVPPRPVKRGNRVQETAILRRRRAPSSLDSDGGKDSQHDEGYQSDFVEDNVEPSDTSDPGAQEEPNASGYYDTDADENGNLAGFVVDDDNEDEDDGRSEDHNKPRGEVINDTVPEDKTGHISDGQEADTEDCAMDVDPDFTETSDVKPSRKHERSIEWDVSEDEGKAPRKRRVRNSNHAIDQVDTKRTSSSSLRPPSVALPNRKVASLESFKKVSQVLKEELGMDQAAFTSLMKSFVASGGSAQSAQSPAHDHDEQPASKVKVISVVNKSGQADEIESAEPEDRGCEVTEGSRQTGPLRGTYNGLPPLKDSKWQLTNDLALATLTIVFDNEKFPDDMSLDRIRSILKTICVPSAYMTSPSRDAPSRLMMKTHGNGQTLAFKKDGELAGVVAFGINLRSVVVDGRTYTNAQGATRLVKEIEIALIMQEGERFLAMLSMVTGGKNLVLPVTDNGGISFSTKHTTVDEDGDEEPGKGKLAAGFLKKGNSKVLSRKVVHADIQRRAREATETVPVFNSTKHFRGDERELRKEQFHPEDILTQRGRVDPSWNKEIPVGALVAVHGTMTTYKSAKASSKMVSFNLCAVQILALPKGG